MKKIAVVGGGITGLTAAFQLQQAGLHPLLFESGAQAGGAVQTQTRDGYQVEAGPNSLQESPAQVSQLIEALGLEAEVIEANPAANNRFILRHGHLWALPSSPPALLKSPVLSWRAKLRLLKEPFIPRPGADTEESLASFTRRRLGPEVLDYLVNPFIGGIYAGDPEALSARYALPRLFALEHEHGSLFRGLLAAARNKKKENAGSAKKPRRMPRLLSFRSGLATLPQEMARRLRQHLYLETSVETITPVDGKWELVATRYGRRLRDTFDAIILAVPPRALAQIQITPAPGGAPPPASDSPLPGPFPLHLLQEMLHPPVVSVSLGFQRNQIQHPLNGFGALFPEKEKRKTLGVLFPSTLFPGRAPEGQVLLTCFVGGTRQPELTAGSEEDLVAMAVADLRPLLGIDGEPCFSSSCRWPHAIPQYNVGHGRFVEAIDAFEATHAGLFVSGPARDGISLGQCIASGFRHAERATSHLQR